MVKAASALAVAGDQERAATSSGMTSVNGTPAGRLARSSCIAFGIHVGGAGVAYCAQMALARAVGAESYGIYAYVLAWMTTLAYLSTLGFDVSLLKLVPVYRAQRAWALLLGVIHYAEWRATCAGFAVVLIGSSILLLWNRGGSPELTETFLTGFVLVPVWALLWIRSAIVRALGGVASALAPDRIVRDGLLLVFIGLASLFGRGTIDASFAMLATLVGSAMGLGLVSVAANRRRPAMIRDLRPEYARQAWRSVALPLMLLGVGESVLNRTGVLLLGWTQHTTDAGIYALAFNITFMLSLPRAAVNALFAPMISDLFIRNDRAALQRLITRTSCWTLLGAAGMALPLAVFAEPLLSWFGPEFAAGAAALRILLIGQVIAGAAGSQLYLMTMTGHERAAAVLLLLSTAANAAAGYLLISVMGLSGAAIATTAAFVVWNALMALFIGRSLRLVPGVLAIFRQRPPAMTWLGTGGARAGD
jgi:O-antigen/teichoic acid export membrane protein